MSSSQSNLAVLRNAQPLHPLSAEETAQPAVTPAPAVNAEPAPIAALDALALCAASGAMGG